jgi:cell division protein ZapA
MSAIRDAGIVKARERIAVLAALNLAYQLAGQPPRAAAAAPPAVADDAAVELDALIRRVDAALDHDGRLL